MLLVGYRIFFPIKREFVIVWVPVWVPLSYHYAYSLYLLLHRLIQIQMRGPAIVLELPTLQYHVSDQNEHR